MTAISHSTQPQAVSFRNANEQALIGVWHPSSANASSANASRPDCALILLHGWSGYRSGPHQMLTRAARVLAEHGYPVLRFDFAGRGDSDGDAEATTLATMSDDAAAAIDWCRREQGVSRVILLGLCSGCEVALATATNPNVRALALWSGPVFAAAQSDERAARKRRHHLKSYVAKLLRPATYAKILSGRLDTQSIRKAVGGTIDGESKNVESDASGQLPRGWRAQALQRLESFAAPLLLVYGTADPTTEEALTWHRAQIEASVEPRVHRVQGANHSYYGLAWESEVFAVTLDWLRQLTIAD